MTRKSFVLVAMFIALGTFAVDAPSASAVGNQVPFSGSYSGAAVADFSTGTITFSGTGIATHLGLSTNEGYAQVTGFDSSCPGGLANVNYETLTGTNGDSLTLISYDVGCEVSQGVYHGTGHWMVTGGTGRFSGATGQGTLEGDGDFNRGQFSFQLTGTISAPTGR